MGEPVWTAQFPRNFSDTWVSFVLKNGQQVAQVKSEDAVECEDRAEFIVLACNCHEDLLAAAREAEAALIVGGTETEQLGVREMLYEAILKAEEGEAS